MARFDMKVCLNNNCKEYRYNKNKTKWRADFKFCPICGLILQKERVNLG